MTALIVRPTLAVRRLHRPSVLRRRVEPRGVLRRVGHALVYVGPVSGIGSVEAIARVRDERP